jgi:hypothetical protein
MQPKKITVKTRPMWYNYRKITYFLEEWDEAHE